MTDVVGLYLNPPQQAMVLCVDEKSQIQALDRTQPGLPIKKGRCGTMTHDYKRNGTTTLFAALETLQGRVVGECHQRHRHQEFLRFLRRLDQEFPGDVPCIWSWTTTALTNTRKCGLAEASSPVRPPLRAHQFQLAESGRALVRPPDNKAIKRGVFLSVPICRQSLPHSSPPGMKSPNLSSGPRPSNPSRRSSPAAARRWNRFNPAAPVPKPENAGNYLSSYFLDTTLVLLCYKLLSHHELR